VRPFVITDRGIVIAVPGKPKSAKRKRS